MREWRRDHPLVGLQKLKDSIRHKTQMRVRRGLLLKFPCEVCNNVEVEAHHDDYNKPYEIRWLCFKHHREHHKNLRLINK